MVLKSLKRNHFVLVKHFSDALLTGAERDVHLEMAKQQHFPVPGLTAEDLTCRALQTVSGTILANYICVCVQCISQIYF